VIIVRTPLRIPLGGGGTDLKSYYSRFGGYFLTAAIQQYVTIQLSSTFNGEIILKYSDQEKIKNAEEIRHPIIREALRYFGISNGLELVSLADIPSGSGLGSSGAFTVSLVHALKVRNQIKFFGEDLAHLASKIEIDILGEPVGKQDPYACALGGIRKFEIDLKGEVRSSNLNLSQDQIQGLEQGLVMYFTGFTRSASQVLSDQVDKSVRNDIAMLDNLHKIKAIGREIENSLKAGDFVSFAQLMDEHWKIKRNRSPGISTPEIDMLYDIGMKNGALGGKLIGAGGGGFILFYTKDRLRLERAMFERNIKGVPIHFADHGSKAWVIQ
jgi:D-glycero-alpha-D-manno-heptose-7-phosphate kinase